MASARGSFRERVRAVEPDEVGPGDGAAAHETPRPLLEQDYRLLATRAYRLDESPAHHELLREGWRDGGERRGDEDRIVEGVLRESLAPVPRDDLDVLDPVSGEVVLSGFGDIGEAFHAPHKVRQVGEQRRLEAVARADLEDALGAGELQSLDHLRRERRLGRHLLVRDRQRPVQVGALVRSGGTKPTLGTSRRASRTRASRTPAATTARTRASRFCAASIGRALPSPRAMRWRT